ncbi:MAG: hypothetical protein ACI4JB_05645 [Porcipelethomonas sp.]
MKKVMIFLCCLISLATLAGCSDDSSNEDVEVKEPDVKVNVGNIDDNVKVDVGDVKTDINVKLD